MTYLMRFSTRFATAVALIAGFNTAHALRVVEGQVILDKMEDYPSCVNQATRYESVCTEALKRWVEQHPDDAFKAGKIVVNSRVHRANAMPFFELAFKAKKGDCKDEDVLRAVKEALPLMSGNDLVKPAQEIGLKTCFNEMKAKIFEDVPLSQGGDILKNICQVPEAASHLPPLKQAKCKDLK